MRTIIAGSRTLVSKDLLHMAIDAAPWTITEVVCGMARGVDRLGYEWAEENDLHVLEFPAEWEEYGRTAGILRNNEMALNADALIAIWDGQSRGTAHMIKAAKKLGLPTLVLEVSSQLCNKGALDDATNN